MVLVSFSTWWRSVHSYVGGVGLFNATLVMGNLHTSC